MAATPRPARRRVWLQRRSAGQASTADRLARPGGPGLAACGDSDGAAFKLMPAVMTLNEAMACLIRFRVSVAVGHPRITVGRGFSGAVAVARDPCYIPRSSRTELGAGLPSVKCVWTAYERRRECFFAPPPPLRARVRRFQD